MGSRGSTSGAGRMTARQDAPHGGAGRPLPGARLGTRRSPNPGRPCAPERPSRVNQVGYPASPAVPSCAPWRAFRVPHGAPVRAELRIYGARPRAPTASPAVPSCAPSMAARQSSGFP